MNAFSRHTLSTTIAPVAFAFFASASACSAESSTTSLDSSLTAESTGHALTARIAPGDILAELRDVPGIVDVQEGDTPYPETRFFLFRFEQPVDHLHPTGPKFTERFKLVFRSYDAPVIVATSGYDMSPNASRSELGRLLDANTLSFEHRFFGESVPEPKDWSKLDIFQAATDEHRIIQALQPLFTKKWISTGVSKGGMTSVYHRFFYPNDVFATVAYSAPQLYGREDPRYISFLEQVGDAECRNKLKAFQIEILRRRTEFEAKLLADASSLGETFDTVGVHNALDDAVMFASFAFWMHGSASCQSIPAPTSTTNELYDYLDRIYGAVVYSDSDSTIESLTPYYYQTATELGAPGCQQDHLRPYLFPGYECTLDLPPFGVEKRYHAYTMPIIGQWVRTAAKRMIVVYGEYDPYSARPFTVRGENDSYRYVVPGGSHGSGLGELPAAQKNEAYDHLRGWADVPAVPGSTIAAEALEPPESLLDRPVRRGRAPRLP